MYPAPAARMRRERWDGWQCANSDATNGSGSGPATAKSGPENGLSRRARGHWVRVSAHELDERGSVQGVILAETARKTCGSGDGTAVKGRLARPRERRFESREVP